MPLSTFAFAIGIIECVVGLPMMLFPRATGAWLLGLMEEERLLRVLSVLSLILCGLVLLENPSVSLETDGLVRLVAWMGAIKGLLHCWFPKVLGGLGRAMLSRPAVVSAFGLFAIGFGGALFWAGMSLRS